MSAKDDFDRVLRWMVENLTVASSIYRSTEKTIAVDPGISVDSNGHPQRISEDLPSNLDSWFLNSGSALIACCYVDALGKVVLGGTGGKRAGFERFLTDHMGDFVAECTQKGAPFSLDTLWKVYRNGFVHQFASGDAVWGRKGRQAPYWFEHNGRPGINIDRFVAGVIEGIGHFRTAQTDTVDAGKGTYEDYLKWLDS